MQVADRPLNRWLGLNRFRGRVSTTSRNFSTKISLTIAGYGRGGPRSTRRRHVNDPPFKYKKAAPSLLQTTSSQPPFHFSKHPYTLNLIAKMASAESDLVRCYDNGRALHANIGLKRTQKMCGNMIAGSKSVKRQASPPEGSRGRRSRCSIMKPC